MNIKVLILLLISALLFSCDSKEQFVIISTQYGDMTVKLYDKTPLHRDNFIKLIKTGFYENLLFHQVDSAMTIQGGSADSRNAAPNRQIGLNTGVTYSLPAEIIYPDYFHKKGAIGAMPFNDTGTETSGSLFYIVNGIVYTNEELNLIETNENEKRLNRTIESLFMQFQDSLMYYETRNEYEKFSLLQQRLIEQAHTKHNQTPLFAFTAEQRQFYTTTGGIPQMDRNYTVFGEITEGIEVLDEIAHVQTYPNGRPVKDVKMTIRLIK